jgi:hypothetical protein
VAIMYPNVSLREMEWEKEIFWPMHATEK